MTGESFTSILSEQTFFGPTSDLQPFLMKCTLFVILSYLTSRDCLLCHVLDVCLLSFVLLPRTVVETQGLFTPEPTFSSVHQISKHDEVVTDCTLTPVAPGRPVVGSDVFSPSSWAVLGFNTQ